MLNVSACLPPAQFLPDMLSEKVFFHLRYMISIHLHNQTISLGSWLQALTAQPIC